MYNSIFEAVSGDSNTVYLSIPEEDYFLSYESVNRDNIEELVGNYFDFTGRDGIPSIANIDVDANTHKIKVTVNVSYEGDAEHAPDSTPHYLAQWRQH